MKYQELYRQADEELKALKAERSSIERIKSRMTMLECCLRVLAEHNLMDDLAKEYAKMQEALSE